MGCFSACNLSICWVTLQLSLCATWQLSGASCALPWQGDISKCDVSNRHWRGSPFLWRHISLPRQLGLSVQVSTWRVYITSHAWVSKHTLMEMKAAWRIEGNCCVCRYSLSTGRRENCVWFFFFIPFPVCLGSCAMHSCLAACSHCTVHSSQWRSLFDFSAQQIISLSVDAHTGELASAKQCKLCEEAGAGHECPWQEAFKLVLLVLDSWCRWSPLR